MPVEIERERRDDAVLFVLLQDDRVDSSFLLQPQGDQDAGVDVGRQTPLRTEIERIGQTAFRHFPNVKKEEDGKYHITNVNCYEILQGGRDTMEEIAAMKGILPVVIRASEILNVDAEMRPLWREFLEHLALFPRNDHPDAFFPRGPKEPIRWTLSLKPVWRGSRSGHYYTESLVPSVDFGLCTLESPDRAMMEIANATFESYFPDGIDEKTRIGEFSRLPIAAARLGRSADIRELIPIQLR